MKYLVGMKSSVCVTKMFPITKIVGNRQEKGGKEKVGHLN